ncbi:MAG: hypothetical protein IIW12_08290 [Oscillospiraceae bacterium]|nr:hypothetical protein [Oscillospiraceae bacterium]
MHVSTRSGIILPAEKGSVTCPFCNKKIARIEPDTEANNLPLFCRFCKREYIVDIRRERPERQTPEP